MRRLRPNQLVIVDLDDELDSLEGRVVSLLSPVAKIHHTGTLTPRLRRKLTSGSLAFMAFLYEGSPVALRGVARSLAEDVAFEFVVIDGIQLQERRGAARIPMQVRVRVTELGGDAARPIDTRTVDMSLGGALLERRPGFGAGTPLQIEIFSDRDPIPIRCRAAVAHQTAAHVGIAFTDVEEPEQVRLAGLLVDHLRHEVGRLKAEQTVGRRLGSARPVRMSAPSGG
jgi:PilZ domain